MLALQGLPILAALLIATLLIIWAIRVIKETVFAALAVLLILAVLFFGFGVTPVRIWQEFWQIPAHVWDLWQSLRAAGS
jgi:hypothetical protein